ncbi:hypothetical protein [Kingella sp. (in: b-proteobacteria)]|uniref:hypothetical protein n=1 Tax=Kingella sp. (in: b-proteobacteria) TaxID=2020713 RepID=UPI0026DAE6A0|nr:hypothetical protein [Kingella sp. (in: b-proteobacteria)]MDO4656943.1 hypothetical protein [Kingella sp. (in: b-proteobacteria)]
MTNHFQAASIQSNLFRQPETFAKPTTDGASAARRHISNQRSPVEYAIWRRAGAAPF